MLYKVVLYMQVSAVTWFVVPDSTRFIRLRLSSPISSHVTHVTFFSAFSKTKTKSFVVLFFCFIGLSWSVMLKVGLGLGSEDIWVKYRIEANQWRLGIGPCFIESTEMRWRASVSLRAPRCRHRFHRRAPAQDARWLNWWARRFWIPIGLLL